MGGVGSKKDQQDLEKEIEKKLEKELENIVDEEVNKLEKIAEEYGVPEEEANKIIKKAREEALREGKKEMKDNRKQLTEELKEEIKKDPILWCPKDDKSGCTIFPRSEKPTNCIGYFTKNQCEERSGLKKAPVVSNLYSQKKNLRKGSLSLNEPMVWCPNNEKTSCVSSPRSKKPIGCIGDFSKDQCERSRLKKVKKQNLPSVNNLVTQKTQQRNTGFRREAPMVWCPNNEKTSCVSSSMNNKPISCFGDFSKEQCERSRLKKVKKQNLPSVNNLVTQRTQQRNIGFRREAPMVWCPNNEKTSCVSSSMNNKPSGCFGDFSKEQCERSRLQKIKVKQNSPTVNTLVTQKTQQRNVDFRREAPKAWCPTIDKNKKWKAVCEYRTIDSTCKPPSFSEQQCLDKFPCQLIKTYQGPDKEKLKNICRIMGDGKHGKMTCLSDNAQINAKELGAHCVWKGEVCLPNKDLLGTAVKEGVNSISERNYISMCKGHSLDKNKCEDNHENYHKYIRRPFKNNESNLCKTFYN